MVSGFSIVAPSLGYVGLPGLSIRLRASGLGLCREFVVELTEIYSERSFFFLLRDLLLFLRDSGFKP